MDCVICGNWFSNVFHDGACPTCSSAIKQLGLNMTPGRLLELAQAEKDGRLVVLPCKIGDSVYRIAVRKKYLNRSLRTPYIKTVEIKPENALKYKSEIGKTVFLTREEAEAALKKREEAWPMTREEAIKALDVVEHMESFSVFYEPGEPINQTTVGKLKEACRMAISALRTRVDTSSNDPLTLEELREMDGDKIYVHYINGFYTDEDGAYFGKFEQLVRECNGRLTACELPLEYYGKAWIAYRRKPEEGAT